MSIVALTSAWPRQAYVGHRQSLGSMLLTSGQSLWMVRLLSDGWIRSCCDVEILEGWLFSYNLQIGRTESLESGELSKGCSSVDTQGLHFYIAGYYSVISVFMATAESSFRSCYKWFAFFSFDLLAWWFLVVDLLLWWFDLVILPCLIVTSLVDCCGASGSLFMVANYFSFGISKKGISLIKKMVVLVRKELTANYIE